MAARAAAPRLQADGGATHSEASAAPKAKLAGAHASAGGRGFGARKLGGRVGDRGNIDSRGKRADINERGGRQTHRIGALSGPARRGGG